MIPRTIIALSLLWLILTEGDVYQAWLGLGFVMLAAISVSWLTKPGPSQSGSRPIQLLPGALGRYLALFISQSLTGGIDVARRALRPGRNVRPLLMHYHMRIPATGENARMVFAISICLFPGSLSCSFKNDVLIIHMLDEELANLKAIERLEERVAALFSIHLT